MTAQLWSRSTRVWFGSVFGVRRWDGSSLTSVLTPVASVNDVIRVGSDVWAVAGNGAIARMQATLPDAYGGACTAPIPIGCEATLSGSTLGGNVQPDFGCATRSTAGPATVYRLDVPVTGTVTVRVTPHDDDVDLVVIGATTSGGCDAQSCIAASGASTLTTEETSLSATRGDVRYIVVDSVAAAASYTISVQCAKAQ